MICQRHWRAKPGEKRNICHEYGQTFTAIKGTLFYRLRSKAQTVPFIVTLLACGCLLQVIVKAFGLQERTVKAWRRRSREHCGLMVEHATGGSLLDLQ